jgi:hypothetical protein
MITKSWRSISSKYFFEVGLFTETIWLSGRLGITNRRQIK